jgi:hypothetical protein
MGPLEKHGRHWADFHEIEKWSTASSTDPLRRIQSKPDNK